MKRIFFSMALLSMFLSAESAYSQQYRYNLPHVANGSFGQGSFRTTFVVFNNSDRPTFVFLKLTADNGAPLTVTVPGLGTDGQFGFLMEAGASRILQTDGSGSLAVGAAYVTSSPADIGVSSIFSIYDNSGNFVTEAGVGNSDPLPSFLVFVDATGAFNTGLALFNPTTSPASITFRLLDQSGRVVSTAELTPPLPGGAHLARFAAGPGQLFPNLSDFKGMLEVSSSVVVCALTLRQNSSTPSPTYTSLPVLRGIPPQTSMIFPQAANGSYGSIAFKTSFLIFNFSGVPANVALTLTQDNGSPFVVTMPGAGTGSAFNFALQPGASIFLQTDGTGSGTAGAASVTSDAPIGAASIFTVFNSQGQFQTEAGVGASRALTAMTLPVDVTGNFDTGVAFYNPGSSPVTMTLRLLDAGGFGTGPSPTVTLEPKGHKAKFVSELFPGTSNFRGALAIAAPTGVAALTLRQNSSPLSYTTLPVASGTSVGQMPIRPLLSEQMSGVSVVGNITVDKILPSGYRLSGGVIGTGFLNSVTAVSGTGSLFGGRVDQANNKYVVIVPAGTYTPAGCFLQGAGSGQAGVIVKYADPAPVQVSADTARDLNPSAPTLFSVSGTIAIGSLNPALASPAVSIASNDRSVGVSSNLGSDGAFSRRFPAGSYQLSLTGIFGQGIMGALYNIGSLNVTGDIANASFPAPATARLAGRISVPGLAGEPIGHVIASDISAPAYDQSACVSLPADSTGVADSTGAYQLILARNRSYNVQAWVQLRQGSSVFGYLLFPAGTGSQVAMVSDSNMDFSLPAVPALFVISGRVTDSLGRGVNNVVVTAVAQSLAGASQMSFTAGTPTDANGAYRLTVPAGLYQLAFTPPIPAP